VRDAIAYASPSLAAALARPDALHDGTTLRAVTGYVARMAGRPVPFGLFAGCTCGRVAGSPAYDVAGRAEVAVHARADVETVPAVGVTYRPNSTLYDAAGRLRFVEREGDRYHPVAVDADEFLTAALDAARDGATLPAVAAALAGDDVTEAEATAYVADLVDAQLLVPDAGAAVTGDLPATGARVHVDTVRPAVDVVLGGAVLREARRAVEVLLPLYRTTPIDDDLARFRAAFAERYGDAEVPLGEALDEETGIGFGPPAAVAAAGAPLLARFTPSPSTDGPVWTPIDHHLVDLLARALRTGARELELGPADLGPLRTTEPRPLPDAVAVVATVAARSAAAVAAGEFRLVVHSVSGPNGVALVSRFAPFDDGLGALVRGHVAAEEALRTDAVFAEVVHLPDGRAANVAVRPPLRPYEIPLHGVSRASGEHRVAYGDLLVSVSGDRVVLRSKRLGREVLPRLTAAHDYRASRLPAYRFLGAVAHDGTAGLLGWSWGQVQSAPYLPRVVVGRLVLARAQWRWFRADHKPLSTARTPEERYDALQALRRQWGLPRWVTVARGDLELPLDLDGVAAAELLHRAARIYGQLTVRELLPAPDELCVSSPDGALVHDVVLPLVRTSPRPSPLPAPPARAAAYVPGSEWLALRLFTGVATADAVLREVVAPLVAGAAGWSYERRPDPPHAHLLVRIRGGSLPRIADPRVRDVEVVTYRPDPVLAGLDAVLTADSAAALLLLGEDLESRWRATLFGIDALLADAGVDDRRALVRGWRDALAEEHGRTGERALRYAGRVWRTERLRLAEPEPLVARVLAARSEATRLALPADAGERVLRRLAALHVNRMLRAAHAVQELVLYDLLDRVYVRGTRSR
jgi:hypothetical protein